ncbi:MAG: ornithine cyclodeaminase family protein [Promethearchaeota archaeon]
MEDTIILTQSEVKECLSMKEAISAVRTAYSALARGHVQMPSVQHLDVSKHNGEVDVKTGYVEDFGLIGTKIASGFYDNPDKGFPPGVAVIVLLDLETSMPVALMDGTHITAYRTGAAGAVAADVLARRNSHNVGIVGAGTQGRMQLLALQEIFDIKSVKIWDRKRRNAEQYEKEMSSNIQVVDSPEQVVEDSDIVVTATASREPLIGVEAIHDGLHINAIGADGPGKQELDPAIMARASKIVVDSFAQCQRIGEIQHALKQGLITDSSIHAEIGEIIIGHKKGRESDDEITLFDATGLSPQDIAAAKIVLNAAKKKDLGRRVSLLG